MAILALSADLEDLRERLSRVVVGWTRAGGPVTVESLGFAGSLLTLLRHAIMPNMVQTQEGQPSLIHAGPFGNIAHGCNSIIADRMALGYADFVVTEAGFGSDLGFEKFMHIKARQSGLIPNAVVLVASVRALKWHGGTLRRNLDKPDVEAVAAGGPNLEHHISIVKSFNLPVVVAINRFHTDSAEELAAVKEIALKAGADSAAECDGFARGGAGATELGERVMEAAGDAPEVTYAYPIEASAEEKALALAKSGVQRGKGELDSGGTAAASEFRGAGMGTTADLHGQDPPIHFAQPVVEGTALGVHFPHRGYPGIGGGRVPVRAGGAD